MNADNPHAWWHSLTSSQSRAIMETASQPCPVCGSTADQPARVLRLNTGDQLRLPRTETVVLKP